MNKKIVSVIFTVACLGICVLPFAGMLFAPSNEAVGNEQQTTLPSFHSESGGWNEQYLQQLGDYFSTHYAFRSQIISIDAEIQSRVFGVSNLDSVVVGKNNWLYYSSTLDDYLGRNLMSPRAIFNTMHNLELTQEYLNENNIEFLFTISPNKNTLYPENMPYYYSKREKEDSNLKNFTSALQDSSLNYCDLFTPLASSNEVLYLEQDSHWNNKGALIAYNQIMDSLGKTHDDYDDAQAVRTKGFYGDLGKMIYPATQQPEYNYEYDIHQTYSYVTPTKSVEEAIISARNEEASGSLYMYRDSFGNALLPYLANAYNAAYFTKAFPVNLALEVEVQESDTVVFEIAERNLIWFAQSPPVIPARESGVPDTEKTVGNEWDVQAKISQVNMQYVSVTGCVDSDLCENDSQFLVLVQDKDGKSRAFEAFTTSADNSDFCFQAYISGEYLNSDSVEVSIIIKNGSEYLVTESKKTDIQQAEI